MRGIVSRRHYRQHGVARVIILAIFVLTIPFSLFLPTPAAEAAIVAQWGPGTIQKVASRGGTTCAVADNKAYCWGDNTYGQLGNGTTDSSLTPGPVDGGDVLTGKTVTDIALGTTGYACAVADGDVYCWGRNNLSQLGNGTLDDSSLIPGLVVNTGALAGKTATAVATGDGHACAIADQRAYCWGGNYGSRTGTVKTGRLTAPEPVITSGVLGDKDVSAIELGSGHGCALAEGHVYCWGSNSQGQVGNPAAGVEANQPIEIDMSGDLKGKIITGLNSGSSNSTVCAIADYQPYCWGDNENGQLGDGTRDDSPVPVAVETSDALDGKLITKISVGNLKVTALDADGHVYAWGAGPVGAGGASWSYSTYPINLQGYGELPEESSDIASGDIRCAIGPNYRGLYCWGSNSSGMIGDNTINERRLPVVVLSSDGISGSDYQFYYNTDSIIPGQPMVGRNMPVQLELANQEFRFRYGVRQSHLSGMDIDIRPTDAQFKLRYAQRTAMYCDQQTTGFNDITNTSLIAWNENSSVTNGQQISAAPGIIFGQDADYQTYQSAPGSMVQTNTIVSPNHGIWDFSLRDNGAPAGTDYCLRVFHSDNTPIASSQYTPVVTTAPSEMATRIVDSDNKTVANPSYPLSPVLVNRNCQTVTGMLGTIDQQIQVYNNVASSGWSLSVASIGGSEATWKSADGDNHYSYNDSSGDTPGCRSGPDPGGQLTLNPASATVSSPNGCNSDGLTQSVQASFDKGSVDAITLLSGSSSAAIGCQWNLTGIGMEQTIPAYQPAGEYSLNLQITIVAQ